MLLVVLPVVWGIKATGPTLPLIGVGAGARVIDSFSLYTL